MTMMDAIRMLLFDYGCAMFLWAERFTRAVGARGDRAGEGRGCWAVWCGTGKQYGATRVTVSCSALRRHRNLPGAQEKQGFLLFRNHAGSESVLTEEEYSVKTLPFCGLLTVNFLGLCHFCNGEEYQ